MNCEILLTVSIVFAIASGQQTPTISHISPDRVVKIGDTIDLSCSVQYSSNYPIIWSRVNKENPAANFLISKGSALSITDNRYSIRHDEASSTYTLQVSKIQETDSGTYQYQIQISTTSRVTKDVVLTVLIPPIIEDTGLRVVTTAPNKSIELQCYATGNPKPTISWRRRNNELLPTGGEVYLGNILRVHNVTKHDRGTYYCLADNGVGKKAKRNFDVEVKFAAEVTIPKESYKQAPGHPVDLECHIKGYPTPTIFWIKNGAKIFDDRDYQLTQSSSTFDETVSVLRINSVTPSQYGRYLCRGDNEYGTSEKIIEVGRNPTPVCPPACGVNQVAVIRNNYCTLLLSFMFFLFL